MLLPFTQKKVVLNAVAAGPIGPAGPEGPIGPVGPPPPLRSTRNETVGEITYVANAPEGTRNDEALWRITKIYTSSDGSAASSNAIGAWDDRAILIYE